MQWIDGVKLTNKPAMEAAGLEVTDFVDVGIEATLTQLLGDAGYATKRCKAALICLKLVSA